jgi:methyl-accepting chemotaxis protein
VREGSEHVNQSSAVFSNVADSISKIRDLISEIATASSEQAKGIEQVSVAVSEMDKITLQNAAAAEESASAAEEMNAQAEQMKSMIDELVVIVGGSTTMLQSHLNATRHPNQQATVYVRQSPDKALADVKKPAKVKALPLHRLRKVISS